MYDHSKDLKLAESQAEIVALRAERDSLLSEWNALVAAIGSRTHGGAVGHAAALRARVAELEASNQGLNLIHRAKELELRIARNKLEQTGRGDEPQEASRPK